MEVDYKAIGQRIKIARIKKGVTQETVADLIDITPAHMSNVETGKTKVSLPTLIAIANALSVSVDTLLCDNVITSKIVFEKEAKDILSDCDEYEVRFLVDLMKSAKIAFRKDRIYAINFKNNRSCKAHKCVLQATVFLYHLFYNLPVAILL